MSKEKSPKKIPYYTLVLFSDKKTNSSTYKIRISLVRFIKYFLVILFCAIGYSIYEYYDLFYKSLIVDDVIKENELLKENVRKVGKLKSDLLKLQQYRKKAINSIQGFESSDSNSDSLVSDFISTDVRISQLISVAGVLFETIPSVSPVENPVVSRGFEQFLTNQSDHFGVDIVAKKGAPIKAPAGGIVMFVGWTVRYGHTLIMQHANNYQTVYKHNQNVTVVEGQKVKKNDIVAYLGETGRISSGVHLHFEIWKNGIPIDPKKLIRELSK